MSTKVVYNCDFGGYSLSHEAIMLLCELKGWSVEVTEGNYNHKYYTVNGEEYWRVHEVARHDPDLIQVVEQLGLRDAAGDYADLAIAEISGDRYRIDEYDGLESVVEPEDYDWVVI